MHERGDEFREIFGSAARNHLTAGTLILTQTRQRSVE